MFHIILQTRFVKPVIPGQTLRTDMWRDGLRIYFRTTVVENQQIVLSGIVLISKINIVLLVKLIDW